MSEQSSPTPAPNQKRDIVRKFHDDYNEALADVKIAVEHTATAGWQRIYAGHKLRLLEERCVLAKQLAAHAQSLEDFGLSEDAEKAVKDIAKASAELRDSEAGFRQQVVEPIIEPVLRCDKIVSDYRNQAARDERDSPLHNIGIEEIMRTATSSVPKPKWNDEKGTVEIIDHTA